jgi:multidrug resistance efflux pump
MPELTPEQAQAALADAYARRRRLRERMQNGIAQVTNSDGSGVRYESTTERAKALAIADADIVRLERLAGSRRRRIRTVYCGGGKGL